MYKAIQKIGEYDVGDEVPDSKAEVWEKMYATSPVEKVDGESEVSEDKKSEENKSEPSEKKSNVMLDDYLGRNTNVVKKNIEEDDLSKKQLEELLELESSDKKRDVVIAAINKKLG